MPAGAILMGSDFRIVTNALYLFMESSDERDRIATLSKEQLKEYFLTLSCALDVVPNDIFVEKCSQVNFGSMLSAAFKSKEKEFLIALQEKLLDLDDAEYVKALSRSKVETLMHFAKEVKKSELIQQHIQKINNLHPDLFVQLLKGKDFSQFHCEPLIRTIVHMSDERFVEALQSTDVERLFWGQDDRELTKKLFDKIHKLSDELFAKFLENGCIKKTLMINPDIGFNNSYFVQKFFNLPIELFTKAMSGVDLFNMIDHYSITIPRNHNANYRNHSLEKMCIDELLKLDSASLIHAVENTSTSALSKRIHRIYGKATKQDFILKLTGLIPEAWPARKSRDFDTLRDVVSDRRVALKSFAEELKKIDDELSKSQLIESLIASSIIPALWPEEITKENVVSFLDEQAARMQQFEWDFPRYKLSYRPLPPLD